MTHVTDGTIGIDVTRVSTAQEFELGETHRGTNNTVWLYAQCGSANAMTAGKVAAINTAFVAVPLGSAQALGGQTIGFVQTDIATAQYGWLATQGSNLTITLAATSAATAKGLYPDGTAGLLSIATSNALIEGVSVTGSPGSAAAANVIGVATFPRCL